MRKEEEGGLVYTVYQMAAVLRHGTGATVEAIHLSGDGVMDVPLTPTKRANHGRKLHLIEEGALPGESPDPASYLFGCGTSLGCGVLGDQRLYVAVRGRAPPVCQEGPMMLAISDAML